MLLRRGTPWSAKRIDQLTRPAAWNTAVVREAISRRPAVRKVIRSEQHVPDWRMDREVLVHALSLGGVMPMVKRRRHHEPPEATELPPDIRVYEGRLRGHQK